jgi:alpha,alpha-trehalase
MMLGEGLFMKLRILGACFVIVCVARAMAQTPAPVVSSIAGQQPIEAYIHTAWDTLTRSMTKCSSLIDPKLTTAPVLYLPKDMTLPPEVAALPSACHVRIERLPRKIEAFGEIKESEIPVQGLLYLPNAYVVPGGRFNEMYGWDSYFILLGLLADHRLPLAKGIVENFFFEIDHYGGILNANRTYYFTRSQPPFLSSMIRAVYEESLQNKDEKNASAEERAWLRKAYGYAKRDYALWTSDIHRAGNTGLARYFDIGEGPVPEMADDSSYYSDVIRWLLEHPEVKTSYLMDAPDNPTPAQAAKLARTSCDVRISVVCANAHVEGHRLTKDFFLGDRAMRESGFDVSFRYGPFSGSTHHFADVGLNSLLYKYERDMAYFARILSLNTEAQEWDQRAERRRAAIDKYLWHPESGMYFDYDYTQSRPSTYQYATTFYPLWARVANCSQAAAVEKNLGLFLQKGGLAMGTVISGAQWDKPYGWAPVNWITSSGLFQYGYADDALRLAQRFRKTVEDNFQSDHTIREKYNVVSGSSEITVSAGYKQNVVGFGWTNGVYLQMGKLEDQNQKPVSLCGAAQ